jgi:hypothetical protein
VIKFLMLFPIAYLSYDVYKWTLNQLYPGHYRSKPDDASGFTIMGRHFDPKKSFVQQVRHTMGWLIHEALDDAKVTREGLNFLDRMFRHS